MLIFNAAKNIMENIKLLSPVQNPKTMKTLILALSVFICQNAFADIEKSITKSDINAVKIYLSGAQIERSFSTMVEPGLTTLAVENLSSQIDRSSITATINGNAMVLSTSFELDYLKEKRMTPQLKKLKDSLEILTGSINELNLFESVYNEEIAMLNANKNTSGSNVGVNAENLKKVIDYYQSKMIELKTKILDIDKKQIKLNEKIKNLNEQIEEENGRINRPYGTILVNISSQQSGNIKVDLSYYAQGASWSPTYDIRAKDAKSEVNLMYKAMVNQNTGEDWEKVNVTLSTGNPTLGGNKPQLQSWFLRYYNPVYLQSAPAMESRSKAEGMMMDATTAQPMQKSMAEMVQMEENQLVTEFEIKMPYTILSDGKTVVMDIQEFNLPASFAYYAVPKLDKDAFLTASITGWEKLNLLPGPSKIYLENSYVGESYINPASATDTLLLSFGRDKRISIKRDKVKDMNTVKFIGGNVEKEFMYETIIRNTKKDNITITIEDHLPLSTDESMKITNGDLTNGNFNPQTGLINWKLEIKPGESKKIRMGYKVKYPKDRIIQGL